MDEPVNASPAVLEALTGQRDPNAPNLSPDETLDLIMAQQRGLKRAILRIAREIDQTRGPQRG